MIQVGIIGVGYWGSKFITLLESQKHCKLAACADTSVTVINQLKKTYSDLHFYNSFESLIQNENLDAVIIATPASLHYDLVKKSLDANLHVLVEKPLATHFNQAQELELLAQKKSKILLTDHTFLFDKNLEMVKGLIEKSSLATNGKIVLTRTHQGNERSDVSCVWDLIWHDISILHYLYGCKIRSVTALSSTTCPKTKQVGEAEIFFELENKMVGKIYVSWLHPQKVRSMHVSNEKEILQYEVSPNLKLMFNHIIKEQLDKGQPLEYLVNYFFSKIDRSDHEQSKERSSDIVLILEAIEKSIKLSGEKVLLHT